MCKNKFENLIYPHFLKGFLWQNGHLGFGYFLVLDPIRKAQQSGTKSESVCSAKEVAGNIHQISGQLPKLINIIFIKSIF